MATSSSGLPGKLPKETNWIADEIPLTQLRVSPRNARSRRAAVRGFASPTTSQPSPPFGGVLPELLATPADLIVSSGPATQAMRAATDRPAAAA
jgi:hypothetical protein